MSSGRWRLCQLQCTVIWGMKAWCHVHHTGLTHVALMAVKMRPPPLLFVGPDLSGSLWLVPATRQFLKTAVHGRTASMNTSWARITSWIRFNNVARIGFCVVDRLVPYGSSVLRSLFAERDCFIRYRGRSGESMGRRQQQELAGNRFGRRRRRHVVNALHVRSARVQQDWCSSGLAGSKHSGLPHQHVSC